MPRSRRVAHEFVIAARLAGRSLRRRLAQGAPAVTTDAGFRAELEPWLAALPAGLVSGHSFLRLPPGNPPWHDSGLELAPGDQATVLAAGRVYLSRALDVWVSPALRLWCRLGDGPVFRGTRPTNTFTADRDGRLMLGAASRASGWIRSAAAARRAGSSRGHRRAVGTGPAVGSWRGRRLAVPRTRSAAERRPNWSGPRRGRLAQAVPAPERWSHDWRIGPAKSSRRRPRRTGGLSCTAGRKPTSAFCSATRGGRWRRAPGSSGRGACTPCPPTSLRTPSPRTTT